MQKNLENQSEFDTKVENPINFTFIIKKKKSSFGQKRNKYVKISEKKKKLFLDLIFYENKSIIMVKKIKKNILKTLKNKKAAKELKINYSSAKTILHLFRKQQKPKKITISNKIEGEISMERCQFREVSNFETSIQVQISFGNRYIKTYENIQKSDYVSFNFFNQSTSEILSENSTDIFIKK